MRTIITIGLDEALELQRHLLYVARNDGFAPVAICIVDATGMQLTAVTMDGTKEPSIKTAHAKAITAVKFRRNTIEFSHRSEFSVEHNGDRWVPAGKEGWSDADVTTASKINPTFTHWGGGSLIVSALDGLPLGAIGVSNRTEEQDHKLASSRPSGWTA